MAMRVTSATQLMLARPRGRMMNAAINGPTALPALPPI
jgi:hypothetical protein